MNAPQRAALLYHGRFELGAHLGEGAVGVVYDAFDRERGVHVAIKMLRTVEAELLTSFKTEFRAVHDLEHPNLVRLGELFEDGGRWFFTMELVRGESFLEYVRDETRLRSSLLQLARGLAALHAVHIVHRDIKPSNILVETGGRVVLLDFGLAIDVLHGRRSSDDGMRGTVAYMAPEQAASEEAGPPADWYAVGVVLYEVLTGQLPFAGSGHEMIEQKLTAEPRPVEELAPHVPRDLARLCSALLRSDPAQRAGEAEVLRVLGAGRSDAPSMESEGERAPELFVGRAGEMETLAQAFANVVAGRANAVVVHGESGVGKSCLVRNFSERMLAEQPVTLILHGRCYERESVPYKAVDGAIDELGSVLREQPREVLRLLLPEDFDLLADLFPVLSDLPGLAGMRIRATSLSNVHELRQRAFAALRALFVRVAGWRPVVLIIDDLQWADADSLALLHDVLRPPEAPPLLLLCTHRNTHRAADEPAIHAASLPGDVRELVLSKLPDADASILVRSLLAGGDGDEAEISSIAHESEGHPLFIAELVRQRRLRVHGQSVRLDDVMRARVASLPAASRAVLEHVCVAGRPIPQEVAAIAAGVEPGELYNLVAALRSANLLRTAGVRRSDLVEPFHDRVREPVVANLSADERRAVHLHLARAFEQTGRDDADALATHWQGAGDAVRAAHHAIEAGDRAARALAFDRAVRFYQLARELRARPDAEETELLGKLAQALTNAARGAESAEICLAMAASAEGAQALDLRRAAAEQLLYSGHYDRGLKLLRELCATSGVFLPRSPLMVVIAFVFARVLLRLRGLSFRMRREAQIDRARLARVDLLRAAAVGLTMTDHVLGAYFKTMNTLYALSAGEPRRVLYALSTEAAVQCSGGTTKMANVQRIFRAAEDLAARIDVPEAEAWLGLARGYKAFFSLQNRKAREEFLRAESAWRVQIGEKFHLASIRTLLYRAITNLGELRDLSERIVPALREAEARSDVYAEVTIRTVGMPILALADDDIARARAEMARAEQHLARGVFHLQHYFALIGDVRIDLYEGRGRGAFERMSNAWPRIRKSLLLHIETARQIALEHRARAALSAAAEGGPDVPRLLREAERVCKALERERVSVATLMATVLRACVADARGQRAEALARLTQAEELAVRDEFGLHLAAVRRRRGELIGGDEGKALIASTDASLAAQGVRAPERFCAIIYPVRR